MSKCIGFHCPLVICFKWQWCILGKSRLANLRVGAIAWDWKWANFGSMITYMRLVNMGQKSQAFLTQIVQFWWGNCVSLTQNGWELASLNVIKGEQSFLMANSIRIWFECTRCLHTSSKIKSSVRFRWFPGLISCKQQLLVRPSCII